jgi:MoaA/NifB/PqqE/SkfB family radical SAM enzyme
VRKVDTSGVQRLTHFPVAMPWSAYDTPHAVIEVNQSCNLSCHGCYKDKFDFHKPLSLIREEIDFVASKRNLAALTLSGGEPTLYNELPEVISYITEKGLRPLLLTNASLLTKEKLRAYKEAGLSRVILHIDSRQKGRPDTGDAVLSESGLNELRTTCLDRCREAGIATALCLTVYKDTLEEFHKVIKYAQDLDASYDLVGILVTNYSQALNYSDIHEDDDLSLKNETIIDFMKTKEDAIPAYYVPSSHREKELRWLYYLCGVTRDRREQGVTHRFYIHPRYRFVLSGFPRAFRAIMGRHHMEDLSAPALVFVTLLLYGVLSFSLPNLLRSVGFLFLAIKNRNLRLFSVIFQDAPTLLPDGTYETCRHCPDATVRKGRIVPVCIADRVAPLKE